MDVLVGCKGKYLDFSLIYTFNSPLILFLSKNTDPGKQFQMVAQHIQMLRDFPGRAASPVIVYVERNLGFEAGEWDI